MKLALIVSFMMLLPGMLSCKVACSLDRYAEHKDALLLLQAKWEEGAYGCNSDRARHAVCCTAGISFGPSRPGSSHHPQSQYDLPFRLELSLKDPNFEGPLPVLIAFTQMCRRLQTSSLSSVCMYKLSSE